MVQSRKLRSVVERAGELPAVPEAVAEVLRLTEDPASDMAQLSRALERDLALTAKILRISNSAYYGLRQHVGTLKLALVVLGVREVRNIVLGVSVFDAVRGDQTDAVLSRDFYTHAFTVGALSKKLAAHLGLASQGEAFASGLLHDVGKLLLLHQLGSSYAQVLQGADHESQLLCQREGDVLGFTHADAAAALAEYWNLPKTLADAVWLHHAADGVSLREAKDPGLASVVRVANLLAHTDRINKTIHSSVLGDGEAWEILEGAPSPMPEDCRHAVLATLVDETAASPVPIF
jgi:HD-like signal output (HDOD) protein